MIKHYGHSIIDVRETGIFLTSNLPWILYQFYIFNIYIQHEMEEFIKLLLLGVLISGFHKTVICVDDLEWGHKGESYHKNFEEVETEDFLT